MLTFFFQDALNIFRIMNIISGEVSWNRTTLIYAGCTDIGRIRKHNEDGLLILPKSGLFCIADGAGGHAGGVLASNLALESIGSVMARNYNGDLTMPLLLAGNNSGAPLLTRAVQFANRRIYENLDKPTMATTVVVLLFSNSGFEICHVGDSRVYLYRDNKLSRLTEDHSLVYELYKSGAISFEEMANHPRRNVITNALGPNPEVNVSYRKDLAKSHDSFLLCSDGLSSQLSDEEIQSFLEQNNSPKETVDQLVNAANSAGGKDNITVLHVMVE